MKTFYRILHTNAIITFTYIPLLLVRGAFVVRTGCRVRTVLTGGSCYKTMFSDISILSHPGLKEHKMRDGFALFSVYLYWQQKFYNVSILINIINLS